MAECHQYKTAISRESGIMCEGECKKEFDSFKKC